VETVNDPRVKQLVLGRKLDVMTPVDAPNLFDAFQAPVYNGRSMRGMEAGGAS